MHRLRSARRQAAESWYPTAEQQPVAQDFCSTQLSAFIQHDRAGVGAVSTEDRMYLIEGLKVSRD